jgi:ABC-type glycerol-3-phosphate transport system permease component
MKPRATEVVARYATLGVILAFVGFPLVWMAVSSVKPADQLFTRPPRLFPTAMTTEWYRTVLFDSRVPAYVANSCYVALVVTAANMVFATLGAYSLHRFRYRGRRLFQFLTLSSYLLPAILLLIPLFLTLRSLRIIDTALAVIVGHVILTVPFSIWLLRSSFLAIPREVEEAAMVDGAGYMTAFVRIVLPLAAPGILATALLAFILSWNEYLFASVLVTSGEHKTLPVGIAELVTSLDIRWGEVMSVAMISTLPVLVLFGFMQRYFVKGFLAGATKG